MSDSPVPTPVRFHVALWEPEIPANTANIGRLCLATGSLLHLVGQPGFRLDERTLRRASADHWREVEWLAHPTLAEFEAQHAPGRIFCVSKHGVSPYTRIAYQPGDAFLFGRESAGLPPEVLARYGE